MKYSSINILLRKSSSRFNTYLILFLISLIYPVYIKLGHYPKHDSAYVYSILSYFQTSFKNYGQIPYWIPNIHFGMPITFYQFTTIGPVELLSLTFSFLFQFNSGLLLFATYIFLYTFLTNIALLEICKLIDINRLLAILVCLVNTVISFPLYQIGFNFKLTNIFIISTFFLIKFLFELNIKNFLLYSISFISIVVYGQITYFSIVIFYMHLVTFILFLLIKKCKLQINYKFYLLDLGLLLLFLTILISMIRDMIDIRDFFCFVSPGRNGCLGKNDFENFFYYGGKLNLNTIKNIMTVSTIPSDSDIYIGVLLFSYSVIFLCRNRKFFNSQSENFRLISYTVFPVIIFTLPLSSVAGQIFMLPGMSLVRHVSYFLVLIKPIFLIISAKIFMVKFDRSTAFIATVLSLIIFLLNSEYLYMVILIPILIGIMHKKIRLFFILSSYLMTTFIFLSSLHSEDYNSKLLLDPSTTHLMQNSSRILPTNSQYLMEAKTLGLNLRDFKSRNSNVWSQTTGAVYSVLNLISGEDYCWEPFRQDAIPKNLYFTNHDFGQKMCTPSRVVIHFTSGDSREKEISLTPNNVSIKPNSVTISVPPSLNFNDGTIVYYGNFSNDFYLVKSTTNTLVSKISDFEDVFIRIDNIEPGDQLQIQIKTHILWLYYIKILALLICSVVIFLGLGQSSKTKPYHLL